MRPMMKLKSQLQEVENLLVRCGLVDCSKIAREEQNRLTRHLWHEAKKETLQTASPMAPDPIEYDQ
jgi:hypothetical protein